MLVKRKRKENASQADTLCIGTMLPTENVAEEVVWPVTSKIL
jgi:hypothetical protein